LTTHVVTGILRAMSDDLRNAADRNLTSAATRLGLADPRPAFRERLRILKDNQPDAFATALRHYETTVLPAIAGGGDVLEAWVQYGETIAALSAPGRMLRVDATGRAERYTAPVTTATLVLHVPDQNDAPVLVTIAPVSPTPAQQATLDLLVHGRLGLGV
jgi:hypothetical protein